MVKYFTDCYIKTTIVSLIKVNPDPTNSSLLTKYPSCDLCEDAEVNTVLNNKGHTNIPSLFPPDCKDVASAVIDL